MRQARVREPRGRSSRTAPRRFAVRAVILFNAVLVACVTPAVAAAYWDYQGYLHGGGSYGEAQPSDWGWWWIRVNRSNCNAKLELHIRSDGTWYQDSFPGGCSGTDYSVQYDTSYFSGSHAINTSCCTDVWVNVRIDATV